MNDAIRPFGQRQRPPEFLSNVVALGRVNGMGKSVRRAAVRLAAQDWGLYAQSGQRKYLTAEERRRFIAAANAAQPEARTFCLTLAYIGCRLSEALALTAADIEPDSGLIAVRCLKKRGRLVVRQVPAPPALLRALVEVHHLDRAGERRLWRWHRTRAWQIVKAVMTAAQVYRLPASPKGLRHGFGVHAVLSKVPLSLVQRWMGHSNMRTTAIYTDVLGPEERKIASRMW